MRIKRFNENKKYKPVVGDIVKFPQDIIDEENNEIVIKSNKHYKIESLGNKEDFFDFNVIGENGEIFPVESDDVYQIIKNDNEHDKIDLYGEENWNEEDIPNEAGICNWCGSNNIEYGDIEHYDNQVCYEYSCNDCDRDGQEVYNEIFVTNEKK